ncbi:hypothetical protein [Mesorhizobium silamurunense]|uniref:hypothetical protein n=1 Tax=Mesorhizobium silamurunense TaxID=499528 RepID=UPI001786F8E2|nr:hypothetical protein [Mesorhizobium silamurunense]
MRRTYGANVKEGHSRSPLVHLQVKFSFSTFCVPSTRTKFRTALQLAAMRPFHRKVGVSNLLQTAGAAWTLRAAATPEKWIGQ